MIGLLKTNGILFICEAFSNKIIKSIDITTELFENTNIDQNSLDSNQILNTPSNNDEDKNEEEYFNNNNSNTNFNKNKSINNNHSSFNFIRSLSFYNTNNNIKNNKNNNSYVYEFCSLSFSENSRFISLFEKKQRKVYLIDIVNNPVIINEY